ncbi:MAG: hypothetical protein ABSA18_09175, partial [Dehalococcoidia bacterium]
NFIKQYFNYLRGSSSIDINPLKLREIPIPKATNIQKRGLISIAKFLVGKHEEAQNISDEVLSLITHELPNFEITSSIKKLISNSEWDKVYKCITSSKYLTLSQKANWATFFDKQKSKSPDIEIEISKALVTIDKVVSNLYRDKV